METYVGLGILLTFATPLGKLKAIPIRDGLTVALSSYLLEQEMSLHVGFIVKPMNFIHEELCLLDV